MKLFYQNLMFFLQPAASERQPTKRQCSADPSPGAVPSSHPRSISSSLLRFITGRLAICAAMATTGGNAGIALAALRLGGVVVMMTTMAIDCSARKPDGLVVVSRHGVRRQFPSGTHDFTKYAPGKVFETTDEVQFRCALPSCALPISCPSCPSDVIIPWYSYTPTAVV